MGVRHRLGKLVDMIESCQLGADRGGDAPRSTRLRLCLVFPVDSPRDHNAVSHARRGPAVCSVMSQLGVNASLVMSPPQKLRRRLCLVNPARHLESERGANRSHSHRYVSPDWSSFRQSSVVVPLIPLSQTVQTPLKPNPG